MDRQARQESKAREEKLLETIESGGDPQRMAEAREELDSIKAHIKSATGLKGKVRRTGDEAKRAASTVGKSISRALQLLEESGMPKLARHLQEAIFHPSGMSPAYRPTDKVDWML